MEDQALTDAKYMILFEKKRQSPYLSRYRKQMEQPMTHAVLATKPDIEAPKTGVDAKRTLATALTGVLADSTVLMIKSQAIHWNVVGPLFQPIHAMTERHYRDLFKAIDTIAERIRALGQLAPMSFADMLAHAHLEEEQRPQNAQSMVEALIADHEAMARRFRELSDMAAGAADGATEDLSNARMAFHEEAVWMFRAMIAE